MCKKLIGITSVAVVLALASTSQAIVIGNWENGSLDNWTILDDTAVRLDDVNGVTLGKGAIGVHLAQNDWNQNFLKLDLIAAGLFDAFKANQKISFDTTWLVKDWPDPAVQAPGWNGIHLVINIGGSDWSRWETSVEFCNWTRRYTNEDRTLTGTWDYTQYFRNWKLDDVSWCELIVISNCNDSANYNGPVTFYLDNFQMFGAGGALLPNPANNAVDVPTDVNLSWAPGSYAVSHEVYFGTDPAAVAAAVGNKDPNVVYAKVNSPSFDPGLLQFNTRYSWRVDEVNDDHDNSPWKGTVWSFTTANYLVIDDFESYTNESPARLFQIWRDGLGFSPDEFFPDGYGGNNTGSIVGYDPSLGNIMAKTNVHGGTQAMPMEYHNEDTKISETVRTWAQPQNWTRGHFDLLRLYVRGIAGNDADRLYIKVKDSAGTVETEENPNASILINTDWTEWAIPVTSFTSVNLAAVTEMTIGVGNPSSPKASNGTLFVDDIVMAPKPLGLVAYYALENDTKDSSGNGFDGTVMVDPNDPNAVPPTYVQGPAGFGTAMLFDGKGDHYVDCGTLNPSAATGQLSVALWAKWNGLTEFWQGLIGKRDSWSADDMMWQIEASQTDGALHFQRDGSGPATGDPILTVGQWTHIAVTFDGTTAKFYVDGTMTGEGDFSFGYDSGSLLQFGSSDDYNNPFNGALDEIRIYDRVLSDAEIAALAGK
jgi:hypothetical protein